MEWFQFILGSICILLGTVVFILEVFGVFKMNYVLNRMHVAAMGDTLGLDLTMIGLIIYSGFNVVSIKLAMIMLFMMFTSPVASHLIAQLEVVTCERKNVFEKMDI